MPGSFEQVELGTDVDVTEERKGRTSQFSRLLFLPMLREGGCSSPLLKIGTTKSGASFGTKSQSRLDDTVVFAIPIFQPVRLDLDQKKSRGLNALRKPAFQILHPVVIEHAAIADK